MPQLEKGGKYVFGISVIGWDGSIVVPPEAMLEYKYAEGAKVILMNGSRTSGGFILTVERLIARSEIGFLVSDLKELENKSLPDTGIIRNGNRSFYRTVIKAGGYITLPLNVLSAYGLKTGSLVVSGRGSYLGIGFIARGRIWEVAMKHPELKIFERDLVK